MNECCRNKVRLIKKIIAKMEDLNTKTKNLYEMLKRKGLLKDNIQITVRKDINENQLKN